MGTWPLWSLRAGATHPARSSLLMPEHVAHTQSGPELCALTTPAPPISLPGLWPLAQPVWGTGRHVPLGRLRKDCGKRRAGRGPLPPRTRPGQAWPPATSAGSGVRPGYVTLGTGSCLRFCLPLCGRRLPFPLLSGSRSLGPSGRPWPLSSPVPGHAGSVSPDLHPCVRLSPEVCGCLLELPSLSAGPLSGCAAL